MKAGNSPTNLLPLIPVIFIIKKILKKTFEQVLANTILSSVSWQPESLCVFSPPLIVHKTSDPAVVVLDQKGKHAISLLSGHLGGANDLAREMAAISGGEADNHQQQPMSQANLLI